MGQDRNCKLSGHVGVDGLADQLVNKAVSRGFQFNILCVGETGIGKSTLIETLFNRKFNRSPATHNLPEVSLKRETYDLREANVHLKLSVTETVGFGDQIVMTESFQPIVLFLDQQFDAYLNEEQKIRRNLGQTLDSRIHVCLYFIQPTGHSLRALDLVTMRALDKKVNIIPVIARADSMTKAELTKFKSNVAEELRTNKIQTYSFPTDDEEIAELNTKHNALMPFAVVASTDELKQGNKVVRGRQYPWGSVQVENETHCDFVALREMLIRTNMQSLIESTHNCHYALFRSNQLKSDGFSDGQTSVQESFETRRREMRAHYEQKEKELKEGFMVRVKEKENELKEQEKALHQKFDQIKAKHTNEKKAIDTDRTKLEEEMQLFQTRKAAISAQLDEQARMTQQGSGSTIGGKNKKK